MTKSDVIALQTSLREQGYPVVVDGIYGPQTRDAYAKYLDKDTNVPTVVPPAVKPWWASKTAIFAITTVILSITGLMGVPLDKEILTETLMALATLVSGLLTLWANSKRRAPLDSTLIMPGVRIKSAASLPAKSQSDSGEPFVY